MVRAAFVGVALTVAGCATGSGNFDTEVDGGRDGARDAVAETDGCGVGLAMCASECVDIAFDRENCGGCGTTCASGEVCKAGKCSSDCGALSSCPGDSGPKCVNTKTDAANCGACGKSCPSGQLCADGVCAPDCGSSTRCPGVTPYCADLKTDVKNCGYCGNGCPSGQDCVAGSCTLTCVPPNTKCGAACTNTATDPKNCGACGSACALANATAGCAGGACTVASCASGYGNCDSVASNGCETNTASNVSHCGTCGNACASINGAAGCAGGACTISCNPGFGNCDGSVANGCEVNLSSNNSHCGSCGNACTGGKSCRSGTCSAVTGTFNATVAYSGSPYCSGQGICGNPSYVCAGTGGVAANFTDPVPSGGRVISTTVRIYGVGCTGGLVTVTLNGATIGTFGSSTMCTCGGCEAPYTVTLSTPSGLPGYIYGGSNSLFVRASANGMCMQRAEIALTSG